jgi:hypothetical protein
MASFSRNPAQTRLRTVRPVAGSAESQVDPYAERRRSLKLGEMERGFRTGDVNYDAFKTKIEEQKKLALGGSSEAGRLEQAGQSAQLGEFSRQETGLAQDYMRDPTKWNEYLSNLQQHQRAFREDSPFYLQYQSKITRAQRGEQDRQDTQVANNYLTGSLEYTAQGTHKDPSTGLNYAAGTKLTGYDAYQAYLADQRAKYEIGTAEYVKYDSLVRENHYSKSLSDILNRIGTEQEGGVEDDIRDLIKNYQPGTPQYDKLSEQLKKVAQNKLDNGWNTFLSETVYPGIQAAQSKVDLDISNLVYAVSKGLKVNIDGKEYDFSAGTPQESQNLFNTIYGALVQKKNQLADPKNLPEKPVLAFDADNLKYTFTIPGYEAPEYSSRVAYQAPGEGVPGLPSSNVPGARTPAERDINAERDSIGFFGKFTGRGPDFKNSSEDTFVKIATYGYHGQRDQAKERAALGTFGKLFGRMPSSASDWNKLAAIAYGGITPASRWSA